MTAVRLVPLDPGIQAAELFRLPATVGSGPDADVHVPGGAARHAVIFEREGHLVLVDSGSPEGTWVAGRAVEEVVLRDGDVIQLGPGGPRLRVERAPATAAVAVPAPVSPTLIARVVRQTSRRFRIALAAVVAAAVVALALTHRETRRTQAEVERLRQEMAAGEAHRRALAERVAEERRRFDGDRASLEARLDEHRVREEQLRARLDAAGTGDVQALREELTATRDRIATLETERAAGERIIRQYGGGVALIQGAYAFYDAAGQPLKGPREDEDGDGVHTVDYYGTGFLIDASGLVLTNRHVAEPWWNDAQAEALARKGYKARFVTLRAFFPNHREAFTLAADRVSEKADLALLRADVRGRGIPVLPLSRGAGGAIAGQPVVVVGYPTGLEAILAKTETSVVQSILDVHGAEPQRVTEALSQRGLIRPSTTQGHIGDVTRSDIVFDAPSAQGGSGGPVFNKRGEVIAVEYAVLPKFGGNSFGVPIGYVFDLLRQPRTANGD